MQPTSKNLTFNQLLLIQAIVSLAFLGIIGAVAWHFIAKFW